MGQEKKEMYNAFLAYFSQGNKEKSVFYALSLLSEKKMDVIMLYEEILRPALNQVFETDSIDLRIWREHLRTGIVRTIVEGAYPYVLEKKKELGFAQHLSAVILCPPEEYHDLGARMAADFFTICGVDTVFIGANTPCKECLQALLITKPDMIAISISNYYNLINAQHMIEKIHKSVDYPVTILVGGSGLEHNIDIEKRLGADYRVETFEDVEKIVTLKLKSKETLF